MEFHFKITTWESVTVDEDIEKEVKKKIKKGEITSSNDIYNQFQSGVNHETMLEVDEQMTVEENGGASTIEIVDHNQKIIWKNGE